jgi:hypothetical protein
VGLPKEVYSVKVQHYGEPSAWISGVIDALETESGILYEDIDFVLERGALQEGILLEEGTGLPIPGVLLVAMNPGDADNLSRSQSIGTSLTDGEGMFVFRLPSGVSYLYYASVPEEYVYPDQQGKTFVTVEPGETDKPRLTHRLARKSEEAMQPVGRATIEGRVVDQDGQALAGVPLAVGWKYKQGNDERQIQSPSGSTDNHGKFSITVQATGQHQLVVGGGEFSRNVLDWITVEADEAQSFPDIIVEHYTESIVVTIVSIDDTLQLPPPMITVTLKETGEPIAGEIGDNRGSVEIHVPDAPLELRVWREGYKQFKTDIEPGYEIEVELEPEE